MSAKRKIADERFLADQVRRIHELLDQLTQAQKCVMDDSAVVVPSDETGRIRPLESVRDYRTCESLSDEPHQVRRHGGPIAHSVRHDYSGRKRRR